MIVATNKNLVNLIQKNKFREDLYYRISVLLLHIPPLRNRLEDIKDITLYFLKHIKNEYVSLPSTVLDQLYLHTFPGNIRELENILERFLVFCIEEDTDKKKMENFMEMAIQSDLSTNNHIESYGTYNLKEKERQLIKVALLKHNDNKEKAARELGISRATLWRKIKEKKD